MSKLTVPAFALLLFLGSGFCVANSFNFTGNSATDGPDGNIRPFTSDTGLNVNASAWSRDKTTGVWTPAWLGLYGGGLGVTDSSEGSGANPAHTVDNSGRDNYVLFEFEKALVLDTAYLGYVVTDSDLKAWIGTKTDPYNNHQTLSDAFLTSLGFSESNLGGSSTRTADLNSGKISGNAIVIAALPGQSDDNFKIQTFNYYAQVPDGGATIGLLGLSLAGLSLIGRKRQ